MIKNKDIVLIPHIDTLKLGNGKYAIILPNKIIFLSNASQNEIEELIAEEKEELINKIENEKSEADKEPVANITFLPTFDCNLRCIYCYAKGGEEKIHLTEKLVKASIDAVSSKTKASEINLHFAGGGEPFLNFDLINFAINYSKKLLS